MTIIMGGYALVLLGLLFGILGAVLRHRGSERDTFVFLLSAISFVVGFGIFAYFMMQF